MPASVLALLAHYPGCRRQLAAVDVLARQSMKNVAKDVTWSELQSSPRTKISNASRGLGLVPSWPCCDEAVEVRCHRCKPHGEVWRSPRQNGACHEVCGVPSPCAPCRRPSRVFGRGAWGWAGGAQALCFIKAHALGARRHTRGSESGAQRLTFRLGPIAAGSRAELKHIIQPRIRKQPRFPT